MVKRLVAAMRHWMYLEGPRQVCPECSSVWWQCSKYTRLMLLVRQFVRWGDLGAATFLGFVAGVIFSGWAAVFVLN